MYMLHDLACVVATIQHECRSSIVFCIREVAPRYVPDNSCVAAIKWTSAGSHFAVLSNSLLYFVVRNHTGVVLCSTE